MTIKYLLAGAAALLLAACGNAILLPGQAPVREELVTQLWEDRVSEAELQELLRLPLPEPSDLLYDAKVQRRMFAASSLGNLGVLKDLAERVGQTPGKAELRDLVRTSVMSEEAAQGNFRAAVAQWSAIKTDWERERRRNGKPLISSLSRINAYSRAVATATAIGDAAMLQSLQDDFLQHVDDQRQIHEIFRIGYRQNRLAIQAALMHIRGDYEGELAVFYAMHEEMGRSLSKVRPSNMGERLLHEGLKLSGLFGAFQIELQLGNIAKGKSVLDEIDRSQDHSLAAMRSHYFLAAAVLRAVAGNHEQAIDFARTAHKLMPSFLRRSAAQRANHLLFVSQRQWESGRLAEAIATLDELAAGGIPDVGALARQYAAARTYAGVKRGTAFVPTSDLERFASRTSTAEGAGAVNYWSSLLMVHEHNARFSESRAELSKAVAAGRKFSESLKLMRTAGTNRSVPIRAQGMHEVKSAYLAAVARAVPRNAATYADLLDALTLYQESDTDSDTAAAALRQEVVPGVSSNELRQLQDLQKEARAAQMKLSLAFRAKDADSKGLSELEAEASRAQGRLEEHISHLKLRAPSFARAISPSRTPGLIEIQRRLGASEALVIFAALDKGTVATLIKRTRVTHTVLPTNESELSSLVSSVRRSVELDANGRLPVFDTRAAAALYQRLFAWTKTELTDVRQLVVISGGPLASIPFGLLLQSTPAAGSKYASMPWLVKSVAIGHAPSLTGWLATGGGGEVRPGSFLAWADPVFSYEAGVAPASVKRAIRAAAPPYMARRYEIGETIDTPALEKLSPLPETKTEAEAVARALRADPISDVIHGSRATRSSVLSASKSGQLASKSILMFATHGLAPGELRGLRQPALAMAREKNGAVVPLLLLEDVLKLRVNAEWVILSACNTSAADKEGGDALSGLARGFFFAGAKSLLVTHWPVDSKSAEQITVRTIRAYVSDQRLSRAQALRQASMELISGRNASAYWSHPFFWAPYALVGDGGR